MHELSDEKLMEAFSAAVKIQMSQDFISLLEQELIIRGLVHSKV
ncbi:hypothetical protein KP78_11340 [Jeotgalibacillus soli]|uniref:Sporulation histidine kinase inhibitor Sda n=1 Tax=Jeotgalibacillus soli TaxID=889306 RepID=A0A0C2VZ55_9BACL|nr:hypothetical protein KP78_11340 [Jeotgalibacillus soli]